MRRVGHVNINFAETMLVCHAVLLCHLAAHLEHCIHIYKEDQSVIVQHSINTDISRIADCVRSFNTHYTEL